MTTISFDTHKFIRRLKGSGILENQAEAIAGAFQGAYGEEEQAAKRDLLKMELPLEMIINKTAAEPKVDPNKWVTGPGSPRPPSSRF